MKNKNVIANPDKSLSIGVKQSTIKLVKHYFVYLLMNPQNTVIYVGITNNLIRRIYEHKEKLIKGFTAKYNANKLVYFEIFEDVKEAITREKQIKGGSRRKKIALIEKGNPLYEDLYGKII